ncbi:heavy metal-binding domain-containing protein [Puia sp. P3]|uniref:heavy metal-binding domain-containing protein n=1 Tax=Puia sp. P3 TaxID=3423952 RepID=UPI003D6779DD
MRYIVIFLAAALFFGACGTKKKEAAAPAAVRPDTMYTCSMHPQVMQERPGVCPICGMVLIPVKKAWAWRMDRCI